MPSRPRIRISINLSLLTRSYSYFRHLHSSFYQRSITGGPRDQRSPASVLFRIRIGLEPSCGMISTKSPATPHGEDLLPMRDSIRTTAFTTPYNESGPIYPRGAALLKPFVLEEWFCCYGELLLPRRTRKIGYVNVLGASHSQDSFLRSMNRDTGLSSSW